MNEYLYAIGVIALLALFMGVFVVALNKMGRLSTRRQV